jgi:hypothetical protein
MKCKPRLFLDPVERDHVNDLYLIDSPEVDHPAPIVNMVEIKQICGSPLSTIPEERTWSLDGTHTATVSDDEDFPAWLRGGAAFQISTDSPPRDGETT